MNNTVSVGNKTARVNVTVPEVVPGKTVNNTSPNFGDKVSYTVTVSNDGSADSNNLVVVDTLDPGLVFVGASDGGVYDGAARTITWVVNLTKGGSKVFYVNVTVNAYGVLNNTVSVGNKTVKCTIKSNALADLEIKVVANKHIVHIGDTVIWTVTVKNNGPNKSINVVATDILPNSLKLISYTVSKGTYNVTTGKWNIGDLENKEVAVIIFITKSLRTGKITNNAKVIGDTFDPNMENNFDNDTIKVISQDKPINPDGGNNSKIHNAKTTIKMENTGNPLLIIFLCILTILLIGFKRK